jgi:hypothetical protein
MSREVRRVPANWQHPKFKHFDWIRRIEEERYQPMHDQPFAPAMREWIAAWEAWERGERPDYCTEENMALPYWEWEGPPPDPNYYRPDWPEAERTHLMMYESTSEGTPISPAFETPEELARWLADNNASAFGGSTASYEAWLRIARGGYAPSAIAVNGVLSSGVEALKDSPVAARGAQPGGGEHG